MSAIRLTAVGSPVRALIAAVIAALALLSVGCQPPPQNDARTEDEPTMRGFSWVVDEEFAAMPRPGSSRELASDLEFLSTQDITLLVSLTITPIEPTLVNAHGIEPHHIPVRDFTAPTLEQMIEFTDLVAAHTTNGERIGVHCTAGLGRSGTMSAANFVRLGYEPADAIDEIRALRPGSIETAAQEQAIFDFGLYVSGN